MPFIVKYLIFIYLFIFKSTFQMLFKYNFVKRAQRNVFRINLNSSCIPKLLNYLNCLPKSELNTCLTFFSPVCYFQVFPMICFSNLKYLKQKLYFDMKRKFLSMKVCLLFSKFLENSQKSPL